MGAQVPGMFFETILARRLLHLFTVFPAGAPPGRQLLFILAPGCADALLPVCCPLLQLLQRGDFTRAQAAGTG